MCSQLLRGIASSKQLTAAAEKSIRQAFETVLQLSKALSQQ
jgi:hypothetical protein